MGKKYSVNPFLVVHPQPTQGSWIAINFDSKQEYEIEDNKILTFLLSQTDFLSHSQLEDKILELDYGELQDAKELTSFLITENLLLEEGAPQWKINDLMNVWRSYGWDTAADYFSYIYDYPFVDYSKPNSREIEYQRMSDYFSESPPPNIYKEYSNAPLIPLPVDWDSYSDVEAYEHGLLRVEPLNLSRTSVEMNLEDISALLLFSVGKTGEIEAPIQGTFLRKTVPSGGARHPTEAYIIPLQCRIPREKVYHYSVANHALEEVGPTNVATLAQALLEDEISINSFSAAIILTSIVTRSMWRYREPRAYRVIHNDAGHVLTAIQILARSRNRDTIIVHNFLNAKIKELLKLESEVEIPMSCILIK